MFRKAFVLVVGAGFLLFALNIAVVGISNYRQQLAAQNWKTSMAEVTAVSERTEYNSLMRPYQQTVYDLHYEYRVGLDTYIGEVEGALYPMDVGETFEILYDPACAENSTDVLSPKNDSLIINLAGAIVFAAIGVFALLLVYRISRDPGSIHTGRVRYYG